MEKKQKSSNPMEEAMSKIPLEDIKNALQRIQERLHDEALALRDISADDPSDESARQDFYDSSVEYAVFVSLLNTNKSLLKELMKIKNVDDVDDLRKSFSGNDLQKVQIEPLKLSEDPVDSLLRKQEFIFGFSKKKKDDVPN